MSLLLAIDLGTGSCRAVVFDLEGRPRAMAQREWTHHALPGAPGSQVFDTATNWPLVASCVKEVLAQPGISADAIAAVSSTSMREGMVLYDAAGKEIWACPNVDARSGDEAALLIGSGRAQRIYEIGGDWVSITAPARLLWLQRHEPDTFRRIAHLTMLSDWVLQRLSGRFATDPSAGSSSGMFDLARQTWSPEITALCDLPPAVLPDVVAPGTIVGEVTAGAAAETGLRKGTPVVMGGADTQLGLIGIGVTRPGRVTIVGGTFWQQTAVIDKPLVDPEGRLRTLCHAVPGQWMIEGIGFYSGMTMRWARDALYGAGERGGPADAFVLLEREATEIPPGSNGVVAITSNVMNARRWVHAAPALLGFDLNNPRGTGRGAAVRAIMESAAYVSLSHVKIIESLQKDRVTDVVFTGGAAKGSLWPRILADVLGVPVRVPQVKESTSLGAAIFAGLGAGLFDDVDHVTERLVRFEPPLAPDPAAHEEYLRHHARWLEVNRQMLAITEQGPLRPLWRAPRNMSTVDLYRSAVGRGVSELATPALVLDLALLRRNVAVMAGKFRDRRAVLRPHIKVHKSPIIARMQVEAGAAGVTTATIWEAVAMLRGGISDVLVANQILGVDKVRAAAAAARLGSLMLAIDDVAQVLPLSGEAVRQGSTIGILLEVDIGMGRSGVRSADAARAVAKAIAAAPGLRLRGVQGYEGHCMMETDAVARAAKARTALDVLAATADDLLRAGFPIDIVSTGGTGTCDSTGLHPRATEIQAGSYTLMDRFHGRLVDGFAQAVTIASTVVSRQSNTFVLDAGRKAATVDLMPPAIAATGQEPRGVAEEHSIFDVKDGTAPALGDVIALAPGYAPTTVNLYDVYHVVQDGRVVDIWPVCARGPGHAGLS